MVSPGRASERSCDRMGGACPSDPAPRRRPAFADGGRRTRLVVRQRETYSPHLSWVWHLVEPFNFVMEHRMLRGIRDRAERHATAVAE